MPYKHIYARTFTTEEKPDLAGSLSLAGGMLRIDLGGQHETLDFQGAVVGASSTFHFSDQAHLETNSGRYSIHLETVSKAGTTEHWLNCHDLSTLRLRRFKLNTEHAVAETAPSLVRVSSAFGAVLFAADDGGIVRLYRPPDFAEVGAFQAAQPGTDNHLLALAISRDGNLVAALNCSRTVILYDLERRKVVFTRQLGEAGEWYEPGQGVLFFTLNAEYIISAAMVCENNQRAAAVNVLQFFPLNLGGTPSP